MDKTKTNMVEQKLTVQTSAVLLEEERENTDV